MIAGARFHLASGRLGALGVLLAIAGACAVVGTVERPAPGGTYREGVLGQPLSLNPLLDPTDPITRDLGRLVHAGLVRIVGAGEPQPDLAESWAIGEDRRSYTFRLRAGSLWHDGQPVTAADVVATVALLQSSAYSGPPELGALWRQARADATDALTVQFVLEQPNATFLEACSLPILPAHVFGGDASGDLSSHPASYSPVGAGAYRVQRIGREGVTLVRHDGYRGPRPYLDGIEFRFYPDPEAAAKSLLAGEVDGFAALGFGAALGPEDRVGVQRVPLLAHQTLLLLNQRNSALLDRRVRRAIAMAIDRPALVASAGLGQLVPAFGPIPAYSPAYISEVELAPDPTRARELLASAGWDPARPLQVQLEVGAESRQVLLAEALASQMEAIGVRTIVHPVPALDLYREGLIPRRYDMALIGVWLGTVGPDPYSLWHSSQGTSGFNFVGYGQADRLLEAIRSELDPGRQKAWLADFQRLWVEDVPSIVLSSPVMTYAMARDVHGVRLGVVPEPGARFQYVAEWYRSTARVAALLP